MSCGTCRVCCTVMGVEEIRKAPGEKCIHLCGRGYSIYQFRPASCREFECVWLQMTRSESPLPKKLRPDKSGVLLVATPNDDTLVAHCATEHALETQPMKGHVDRWIANGIPVIRIFGSKRTLMRRLG